jgi:Tol biopolymer transport system component
MRSLKVNETLSALFVGRLFGGPGSLKRITRYQRMDGIDCSPDGTRILFSSPYNPGWGSSNVFSVRTDGSGLVQLTRSHGGSVNNTAAAWSPDGTKIVFTRDRNRSGLYVMNADGTAVTQVTHETHEAVVPVGQPSLTARASLAAATSALRVPRDRTPAQAPPPQHFARGRWK